MKRFSVKRNVGEILELIFDCIANCVFYNVGSLNDIIVGELLCNCYNTTSVIVSVLRL